MKKLLLSFTVMFLTSFAIANTTWNAKFASPQNKVAEATAEAIDDYGFLTTPDGSSWTYTAAYAWENNHISGVAIQIYDEEKNLVGTLNETFELLETDLWVRQVEINSLITKTFFNRDQNYELMLWVDIATKDYKGRSINNAYSLTDTASVYVCSIEGTQLMAKNTSTYSNDSYTMVFWRQEYQGETLYYNYDVYQKATIGTVGPKLAHTFVVPYQNIAALNDPMPLMMFQEGTEISYILSMYEKPFFVLGTSVYEDPVVNENNHFVITHYDSKFNVTSETKIAMEKDPSSDYLYSFYYLGSLDGQNDVIKNYNGTGNAAYVITVDNYETSSDGSVYSYYLYDTNGNRIGTIEEHSLGTIYMSDIAGQPKQYAFLKNEDEQEKVVMVDVPSCERVADIALYNGGNTLSGQWDRVAYGDSYQYVSPLLQGDNAADGSVLQRIAWFNKNGRIHHYDTINMGQKIEYAQLYIYGPVLNPRLFDYDNAYEYMALVKRTKKNSKDKEEALLVCNNKGEILLELGEDPVKGVLNTIDVVNLSTNPTLFCSYSNAGQFTIDLYPLPLSKKALAGEGSMENPYQIASVEDWLQIADNPSACYSIVNDIDFASIPVKSINKTFTGKLDGGKHTLKNLYLHGGGLFAEAVDTVVIKDLQIEEPTMILSNTNGVVGLVVNSIRGGVTDDGVELPAMISNVHLLAPSIEADGFQGTVGGIIGDASLYTEIVEVGVMKANINAPVAENVGGIAGSLVTSSSVHAAAVMGTINGGQNVGGVAAVVSGGEPIYDCHVTANLTGTKTIGGVVGTSGRSPIYNCYVEGTIVLDAAATEGEVGGIVGNLEGDATGKATAIVVENCLVGLSEIQVPEAEAVIAHRIVGFSSVNEYEYDWDNVDWDKPQSEWPRIYGQAEKCIRENYVKSDLAAVDATIAQEATTTEGANITNEELTFEWYAAHGFMQGTDTENPWVLGSEPYIWFETDGINTDVENLWTDTTDGTQPAVRKIIIDGQVVIVRDGKLYNVLGYSL